MKGRDKVGQPSVSSNFEILEDLDNDTTRHIVTEEKIVDKCGRGVRKSTGIKTYTPPIK